MSLRAFLLRALLCLSLVLNGSGYAVASTQMQLTHMAATQASLAAAAQVAPPCHTQVDEGTAVATGHVMGDMASSAACDDRHGSQASPDCCQSSHCACDCLQYATATLADVPALPAVIERAAEIRALSPSHVAPALANPIRPPIG
ncbi:CopL family metal-binding regulatory protein [Lysobacter sp. S4-A87]|uniref:CopL family metal-binding regulatory protein n=1 Tax=Lysobacter sp. S4-A87 TaxID=2925843 RepID=UPI001F5350A1|nr:CopL family metal-binding regulatory protein [Lysobacter sp. S4-A87]UNK49779.1 CopL family metal-binding regulatory protein [Lysobacter sp. S4-A87]